MNLRVTWRGTVASRAAASELLSAPGHVVLVERGYPRLLVMSCPCGCKEELPVNLDPRAAAAWELYRDHHGASLYPSVWRESGCESHFIIWRDRILLFGGWSPGLDADVDSEQALKDAILAALPSDKFVHFKDLASNLDAIPWDALVSCRRLVREGKAIEASGDERGSFRRRTRGRERQ